MFSSHICLDLPRDLFLSDFLMKILCAFPEAQLLNVHFSNYSKPEEELKAAAVPLVRGPEETMVATDHSRAFATFQISRKNNYKPSFHGYRL
jgi:hypothetical protein